MGKKEQRRPGGANDVGQQTPLATAVKSDGDKAAFLERLEDRVLYSADLAANPGDAHTGLTEDRDIPLVSADEDRQPARWNNTPEVSSTSQYQLPHAIEPYDVVVPPQEIAVTANVAASSSDVEALLQADSSVLNNFYALDTHTDQSSIVSNQPTALLLDDDTPGLSSIESETLQYREGDNEVVVSHSIVVNDSDVSVAVVHIYENYSADQDVLLFKDTATITGHFDSNTGVLTLSGIGDASEWQSALRSVSYQNTSNNPETTDRAIEFTINPGLANGVSVSRSVSVAASGITSAALGVSINVDGGNNSYLLAEKGGDLLGGLSEFTTEFNYSITDYNVLSTLISYHSPTDRDSLAIFVSENGQIVYELMNTTVRTSPVPDLLDGKRHSIALTWESVNGSVNVYVDGNLVSSAEDIAKGLTMPDDGVLVAGTEQDSPDGGFNSNEVFSGTLYDIRIWDEVRSATEISASHTHRLDAESLPDSLVANWQFNGLTADDEIVEIVSGEQFSVTHTDNSRFSYSNAQVGGLTEGVSNGAVVGQVVPTVPLGQVDLIRDGGFTTTGDQRTTNYSTGERVGDAWEVTGGSVDTIPQLEPAPNGGIPLSLVGTENGRISQTVITEPGQTYTLKFALSGNFSLVRAFDVGYTIDGTVYNTTVTKPDNWALNNNLWSGSYSTFVATSDTTTISFEALTNDNLTGPWISDIQLIRDNGAIAKILALNPQLTYDPATHKFYEAVSFHSDWNTAQQNAVANELNGVAGRLAVIRDTHENEVINTLAQAMGFDVFLGAVDNQNNNEWHWHDGVALDDQLWTGQSNGSAPRGVYTNWSIGEPNDFNGAEEYLVLNITRTNGKWNDVRAAEHYASIVEWDADLVLNNYSFSIVSDSAGALDIDADSGALTVSDDSAIGYRVGGSYDIVIRVTDATGDYIDQPLNIPFVNNGTPQLTAIEPTPLNYTEGDGPIVLSDSIAIVDSNSQSMESASIALLNPHVAEERLHFTDYGPFTGNFDTATGVLTITGTASQADWRAALRTIEYENTSEAPTTTAREIEFSISDGTDSSSVVTREVKIITVNDAPAIANGLYPDLQQGEAPIALPISDIFENSYTDPDGWPGGIAIVGNTASINSSGGSWEYSLDQGTTWVVVRSVSESAALFLDADTQLRFVPTAGFSGSAPQLTVHAIDDSFGQPYTSASGEVVAVIPAWHSASPFSELSATISTTVYSVDQTSLSGGISINSGDGTDVYLHADNGGSLIGNLDEFTVEIQFSIDDSLSTIKPLLSFATSSNHNELGVFVLNNGEVRVLIDDLTFRPAGLYTDLLDGEKHSIAVSWSSLHGDISVYLDGEFIGSTTNFKQGHALADSGELVFGQEQDQLLGGFDSDQYFGGTYYDIRFWNEVRSAAEIADLYDKKILPLSAPSSLIANWQMRGLSSADQINDVISGVPLTVAHVNEPSFNPGVALSEYQVPEHAAPGTIVGSVVPAVAAVEDLVEDGGFAAGGGAATQGYVSGQTIGGVNGHWQVASGTVAVEGGWASSPAGGNALDLNGTGPGSISQTLSTVPGKTYVISFAMSGNFNQDDSKLFLVSVDNSAATTDTFAISKPDGWSESDPKWNHRSVMFKASSDATKLTFASTAATGEFGPVISDVQVTEIDNDIALLLAADPELIYHPHTHKFYRTEFVELEATEAQLAATTSTLNSVPGRLVTIHSQIENELVQNLSRTSSDNFWIGASDSDTEGLWLWQLGVKGEQPFWTGDQTGSAISNLYTNWRLTEPNNNFNADHAVLSADSGLWGDRNETNTASGYVVEWDANSVLSPIYSLQYNPGGAFDINPHSGQITVADGTSLVHEVAPSHDLIVRITTADGNVVDNTLTVSVVNVNDPPAISGIEAGALLYTENDGRVSITDQISIVDTDSTTLTSASVVIAAGFDASQDRLHFSDTGNITGNWDSLTGTLSLTGVDTVSAWQAAIRSVDFENDSESPVSGTRTVDVTVSDSKENSNVARRNIDVASVNDAPLLLDGSLSDITEDNFGAPGDTIANIFSGLFSDTDGATFTAIAISADASNGEGQWQYSTGNTIDWHALDARGETEAIVFDTSHRLRFVPAQNYNGPVPSLAIYALDNTYTGGFTDGNSLVYTDVTVRGDDTPYAFSPATIDSSVTPVFDPPEGTGTVPGSAVVIEDVPTVLSLNSINVDARDEPGPLTIRLTVTNGNLTWVDDPALTFSSTGTELAISGNANAINGYLSGDVISYLHSTEHMNGLNADSLSVALEYSSNTIVLGDTDIHISAVNDSPGLLDAVLADVPEDILNPTGVSIENLFSGQFSDIDGAFAAVAIVHDATSGEGQWQYSSDNGGNWSNLDVRNSTEAVVVDSTHQLRFVPSMDYHGAVPQLTVIAVDDTYAGTLSSATGQVYTDVSIRGGDTPYSVNTATISSSVTPVFDSPENTGSVADSAVVVEDVATLVSLNTINLDARDEPGPLTIRLTVTHGDLTWIDDPALTFSSTGSELTISGDANTINAYLSGDVISYLHSTEHMNGLNADSLSVALEYNGHSLILGDMDIHITAVNDAPFLLNGVVTDIPEDTANPPGDTIENIFSSQFSDVDGALSAIAIVQDATTGEGQWEYSTDNGGSWYQLQFRLATVIDSNDRLRFVPAADYNGPVPPLTVVAVDDTYTGLRTNDNLRAYINVDVRGDDTPFSVGTATITSSITPVFDPPYNAGSVPLRSPVVEDAASVVNLDSIVLDARDAVGTMTLQLTTANGGTLTGIDDPALTLSNVGDTLSISGEASVLNAYLAGAAVRYQHSTPHTNGLDSDTVSVSLLYSGNAGGNRVHLGDIAVDILPVNDAPILLDGSLANIPEDTVSPAGESIEDIFAGRFSDVDSTFATIAVASDATTTEGVWQYSTDNGSNWHALNARDASEAIIIDSRDFLRFVPVENYDAAIPALTVYGVDDTYAGLLTSDNTREFADATVRGGSTPFSMDAATIAGTVIPVFDPPYNAGTLPDSVNVVEDTASSLNLDTVKLDAADTTTPLSLVLKTSTGGTLNWIDDPSLTFIQVGDELEITGDADALTAYLSSPLLSYLHSTAHTSGPYADSISVDLAYENGSIRLGDIAVHISAVNDAPQLVDGSLSDVPEDTVNPSGDTVQSIFSGKFNDVDGVFSAIAIVQDASSREGQWQYSTDNGSNWYALDVRNESEAMVIASGDRLRFQPSADYNGAVPGLTVFAVDDSYTGAFTSGAVHAHTDVSVRGGSTPYSPNPATIVSAVTPVFDPPVNMGTLPVSASVTEDVASVVNLDGIRVEARDWAGLLSLQLSIANGGTLTYAVNPALIFSADTATLTISGDADALNAYLSGSPVSYLHNTPDINGLNADLISVSLNYGSSSVPLGDINVDITAVNDAPTNASTSIQLIEDIPRALSLNDFGFSDTADGDSLMAVHVVHAPVHGVLSLNGSAVTDGLMMPAADIAAGQLIYTAVTDAWGSNYDRFTFLVQDDGGVAGGGQDMSIIAGEITFDVAPRNDLPSLTVQPLAAIRGLTHTLDLANIDVYEPDVTDGSQVIEVTSAPNKGTLTRTGITLNNGDTFTLSDVAAGLIRYQHGDVDASSDAIGLALHDQGQNQTSASQFATINISVQETHPHIEPDSATVDEHQSVVIPVLSNDIIADAPLQQNSVVVLQPPLYGTFTVQPDGAINYRHDGSETTSDAFTYTVSDTDGDTATAGTVSITINPVSDQPLIAVDHDAGDYLHRSPAVNIATNLHIQDADNVTLQEALIGVVDYLPGVDVVGIDTSLLPSSGAVAHSWDPVSGVLTISGEASVTAYQTLLQSLTYESASAPVAAEQDRSFQITVTDASGTLSPSETIRLHLTVPEYSIDVQANTSVPVFYTEDADPVIVDAGIVVDSLDSRNITRATWQIFGNYKADQDQLGVSNTGVISSSWNPTTGTLVLTGEATAADYQAALRTVGFHNTSQDPETSERRLSLVLESSSGLSETLEHQILVTAVNDAPATDNDNVVLAADTVLTLSQFAFYDPLENDVLQAVIIESLPTAGQLLYSGDPVATGQLIPSTQINAGALTYTPPANTGTASIADQLTFRVQDSGGTAAGGVNQSVNAAIMTLTIEPVAEPFLPVGEELQYQVPENAPAGTVVGQLVDNSSTFIRTSGGDFADASHAQADVNRYAANGDQLGSRVGQWQVTDGSVDLHGSFWTRGPNGGLPLELNGNSAGTIEQQFNTVPGASYQLTYMLSGDFRESQLLQLQVSAGNTSDTQLISAPAEWSPQTPQWQPQTLTFTAEGPVTTLQFQSLTSGSAGVIISDIQVRDSLTFDATPIIDGSARLFNVDEYGVVTVAENLIDFESQTTHVVDYLVHGAGNTGQSASVVVDVIDVNELPVLHNHERVQVVSGEAVVISNDFLAASDADLAHQQPESLIYVVEVTPGAGQLTIDNRPLVVSDQFSQADINANRLGYVHAGAGAEADQFTFRLTDGVDSSSESQTLQIDVHDPLMIDGTGEWTLLQDGKLEVTSTHVNSSGGLTPLDQQLFVVTRPATTATFTHQQTGASLNQFMMQDVAGGLVALQHNGAEPTADEFALSLYRTDTANPTLVDTRNIQLSVTDVSNAPTARDSTIFVENSLSQAISEEQTGFTDGADGDELLSLRIIGLPQTGSLQLNGTTLSTDSMVPASALRDGQLQYIPASTIISPVTDTITFSVIDTGSTDNGGEIESLPQVIQIVVSVPESIAITSVPEPEPAPALAPEPEPEPAPEPASAAAEPIPVEVQATPDFIEPIVAPALPTSAAPTDVQGLIRAQESQFVTRQAAPAEPPDKDTSFSTLASFNTLDSVTQNETTEFRDIVVQHATYRYGIVSEGTIESTQSTAVDIDDVSIAQIAVHSGAEFPRAVTSLLKELNEVRDEVANPNAQVFQIGVLSFSASAAFGVAFWLLRSGIFLGSVLTTVPTLRWLDPLPVLDGHDADGDDGESLQSMVSENRQPVQQPHSTPQK